jgi:hypothetical protein
MTGGEKETTSIILVSASIIAGLLSFLRPHGSDEFNTIFSGIGLVLISGFMCFQTVDKSLSEQKANEKPQP